MKFHRIHLERRDNGASFCAELFGRDKTKVCMMVQLMFPESNVIFCEAVEFANLVVKFTPNES